MKKIRDTKGFTIVELMIAISILSVILLMSTVVLESVGNLFSKGLNMANVQNDSRNIILNVVSSIQFSNSVLNNGVSSPETTINGEKIYAYCFGETRYSYVLGFPPTGWQHILWVDKMINTSGCTPLNISQASPSCSGIKNCISSQSNSGSELTGKNMHLAIFQVQPIPNDQGLFGIGVGLAFGDKDLFITDTSGKNPKLVNNEDYQCNTAVGDEFCATSYLTTLAAERLIQ
jgi:prepilin-type N-terminal cleavage/methylation domain-containing protein